ncbi:transport protein Trs120 or TRAPPC9 TRAPP II complex subunit-domain-containing protein [Phakopsora pachyrhizi]|uniref:Transport protein Trs120 or TRAPPC9 TRAPP II complex subunit-domain-containing protein n=1 Tax=Phakopsora pachyrhizi TaxID=170000 RepID=A0AAV0AIC6_PHAPC|nr:transport protein Trs120 or TRAPPC9 TRAPP II complex subunit-domain-containing protein [Phakopsora pachyrhizi]
MASDVSKRRVVDPNEDRVQALSRLIETFENVKSGQKVNLVQARVDSPRDRTDLQEELFGNLIKSSHPAGSSFVYYSHSRSATTKGNSCLRTVENEPVVVLATLQNPMSFELDIFMIRLSTNGIPVELESCQVKIEPRALKTIELRAIPKESGKLIIRGCEVQLIGYQDPQELIVNVNKIDKGKKKQSTKEQEEDGFLSCEVLEAMPLFSIVGGTEEVFDSGGLVIYEGQVRTFELDLKNFSDVNADWIEVTAYDSLSEEIRKKLDQLNHSNENGYYSQLYRHNLEFELVRRPMIICESSKSIGARETGKIKLRCLGKMGCQTIGFKLEYGVDGLNYKRRLESRFDLSVHQALKIVDVEVLKSGMVVIKLKNERRSGQIFEIEVQECNLMLIAIFEIFIVCKGGKLKPNECVRKSQKQILQPGSMGTQFVVTTENDYEDQRKIRKERRAYWIQEKFFESIQLSWREVGTNRNGEICLRELVMDEQAIESLRESEVKVEMTVKGAETLSSGNLMVKVDEFRELQVKLVNRSALLKQTRVEVRISRLNGWSIDLSTNEKIGIIDGLGNSRRSVKLRPATELDQSFMIGFFSSGKFTIELEVSEQLDPTKGELIPESQVNSLLVEVV